MTVVDADALEFVDLSDAPHSPAGDVSVASTGSKVSSWRRPRALARTVLLAAPAVLAVLAVWFLLYGFVLSGVEQHVMQSRLYDEFRLELASETAPLAEPVQPGSPVAMINAPAAGIDNLIVVEGTTSRLLTSGPGHLSDTPLPGQAGTSVILGRSVTFGGPFGRITQMTPGDLVTVTTGEGVFRYRVDDILGPGSPPPPALGSGRVASHVGDLSERRVEERLGSKSHSGCRCLARRESPAGAGGSAGNGQLGIAADAQRPERRCRTALLARRSRPRCIRRRMGMAEVGPVRDLDRRSASRARRAMGDERCPNAVPAQSAVKERGFQDPGSPRWLGIASL